MAISKIIANITQYISEAAMRIFGPNDDAYPNIGVQPFKGEPYDKRKDDNSQVLNIRIPADSSGQDARTTYLSLFYISEKRKIRC